MAIPNPKWLLLLYINRNIGITMNFRGNPGNPTGGSINPSEGFLYLKSSNSLCAKGTIEKQDFFLQTSMNFLFKFDISIYKNRTLLRFNINQWCTISVRFF